MCASRSHPRRSATALSLRDSWIRKSLEGDCSLTPTHTQHPFRLLHCAALQRGAVARRVSARIAHPHGLYPPARWHGAPRARAAPADKPPARAAMVPRAGALRSPEISAAAGRAVERAAAHGADLAEEDGWEKARGWGGYL
jgi:hypothetical protein